MMKCFFDCHDHHGRRFLGVDAELLFDPRVHCDPSAAVHPIGLVCAGDEEDQPDARVFNEVLETVDLIVAASVGDEQRSTVIRDRHEARSIALGRAVKALPASSGENQKWRRRDEGAASPVDVVELVIDDSLDWRCVKLRQTIDSRYRVAVGEISHGELPPVRATVPG